MRAGPAYRTFSTSAAEKVVANLTSRMSDLDLARLFENMSINTLDITIKWFHDNLTFVVMEWLRDSSNQFK
ncbi:hypothetical protein B0H11DRAFT_2281723, partial [Mycena galericulata]